MDANHSDSFDAAINKQTVFRLNRSIYNHQEILNKSSLRDKRLSLKAIGLHQYMLSMSDTWVFYRCELITHFKDKKDSLQTAIKELIKLGYVTNKSLRCPKGRHLVWETKVYESPDLNPSFKNGSTTGKSTKGKKRKYTKKTAGVEMPENKPEGGEVKDGKNESGDVPTLFWYS